MDLETLKIKSTGICCFNSLNVISYTCKNTILYAVRYSLF